MRLESTKHGIGGGSGGRVQDNRSTHAVRYEFCIIFFFYSTRLNAFQFMLDLRRNVCALSSNTAQRLALYVTRNGALDTDTIDTKGRNNSRAGE